MRCLTPNTPPANKSGIYTSHTTAQGNGVAISDASDRVI